MSDWTPIQFVPLEWTAIRLHQIFKEWPLYSAEMTASIFFPHTNLRFPISFFLFVFFGFILSASTRASHYFTLLYIQNNDDWNLETRGKLHRKKLETVDHGELCLASHRCLQSYKLPTCLSDHLDELTGRAGKNPSTDKALFPACFLKDTSCPLSEEGNWTSLFHGGNRERVSVCEMRQVCVCVCFLLRVIVMHLSESGDDRQQIREAEARWLMPALSDWQRRTYHCFSSPASSVINLICLISKVEAPLSAGSRSCSLKSIQKNRVIF